MGEGILKETNGQKGRKFPASPLCGVSRRCLFMFVLSVSQEIK